MAADSDLAPKAPFLPPRWFIRLAWRIHRALYRWTGGRFGLRSPKGDRYGMAQLTTTGRRTGSDRSVLIAFYEDGDDLVTMAMNGWGAAEPAWWLNLQAEPTARLITTQGPMQITARAATGPERARLWQRWADLDRGLDQLAARRPNETAVVVLSPSAEVVVGSPTP